MGIKVILAEDHHIIRQGIRSLLDKEFGIEVVGEAEDGRETVRLAKELQPDVVVMDVSMPNLNGIEATRKICEEYPDVKVIALSVHSDEQFISGMLTAGAYGYLLKDCVLEELVKAIKTVVNDQMYLSAKIAQHIIQEYKSMKSKETHSLLDTLTPREREVLQMIAESKSVKQIAAELYVSEKTIATHKQNIMNKLGIYSIPDLVKYAIREKIISI